MKKYNTPEMKVSMFNEESVLTVSSGFATFDAFVAESNTTVFEKSWADIANELEISF